MGSTDRSRKPSPITIIAVGLLAAGLVVLGYVGYQMFGSNMTSEHAFKSERHHMRSHWKHNRHPSATTSSSPDTGQPHTPAKTQAAGTKSSKKSTTHDPGDGIGLLSIPAIGVDKVPVLQGTSQHVLSHGIGHYGKTAGPGQIGNFAVAGHRITHGEPFSRLLELTKGATVKMETRDRVYVYKIDTAPKKLSVQDTEGWVLDPVPGKQHARPHTSRITLTTCKDLFHSPNRSVGFGKLVKTRHK